MVGMNFKTPFIRSEIGIDKNHKNQDFRIFL